MPPVYLYKKNLRTMQDIILKAPPIGAFQDFSYLYKGVELEQCDTLLLFSDGLPELFNRDGEMFGSPRVKELFTDAG